MQNISLIFALYCPIYVYVFTVLYLIALISSSVGTNTMPSLIAFHQYNKNTLTRLLFILVLASMLGTPPTLGFFAKILSFYMLVQAPGLPLYTAILLTLILIIFYLQAIRSRSTLRKKNSTNRIDFSKNSAGLVYGQLVFIIFTLFVPLAFDIIYSWLL